MKHDWNWKQCESLLKYMAESMGLMIVTVPADSLHSAIWYIAQRRNAEPYRLTVNYFSPKVLLDTFLNLDVINAGFSVMRNPFYGMSPEEAELRLAVMGM